MFRHISRKVLPVLFIMIALPLLTDSLEAQEGQTTKSNVFTLGEIEVKDKAEENKNITVEKIDKDKMQEFNRDRVSDALNLLPGITVSNTGNRNDSNVYVRGFDIRRTPVFLDGIPIYVPYDRTFDYNRFTTFDLSEIVVSKGFTSVLYGPNTMGGAINLVTLKPQKPFEGSVGAQYGTGNTYYGYANVGTNQKLWYMQAGTSYFNRDYFPMSGNFTSTSRQGDGRRINSYSRDDKIEFRFGLTPAEGHEYAFTYIKQHGEKGQPPDVRSNFSTQYWQWPKWDKESYYLSTSTPIGSKSYVKSRLYYDKFENLLDYFTDITYSKPQRTSNMGERSYYDDYTRWRIS